MTSFLFGAVIAVMAWSAWWPERPVVDSSSIDETISRKKPKRFSPELLRTLENAMTDEEKLAAGRQVAKLSVAEIQKALEVANLEGADREDDFLNDVLLIAWAQTDPEAAVEWAWSLFKKNGEAGWRSGWRSAWEAIGPEWAYSDPDSFIRYVTDHLPKKGENIYVLRSSKTGEPMLDFGREECKWLIRSGPSSYMKAYHRSVQYGTGSDKDFVESLGSTKDYEYVLSTWENLPPEKRKRFQDDIDLKRERLESLAEYPPERARAQQQYDWALDSQKREFDPKHNRLAGLVMEQWKKVDPEGFEQSRFVEWMRKKK